MAELMACRADTVEYACIMYAVTFQFRRAAVGVDGNPVIVPHVARSGKFPFMGPDGILVSALGLIIASEDDEHLVHLAVSVPVVFAVINVGGSGIYRFRHHSVRIEIIGRPAGPAVIFHVILRGIGTDDIKVNFQLVIALLEEIILYGSRHAIVAIALFIEETIKYGLRIGGYEGYICKLNQNDETSLMTCCRRRGSTDILTRHAAV